MASNPKRRCEDEHESVTLFREYLRINTVQPDPDYEAAVTFLKKTAHDIGLEYNCIKVAPKKPIAVLTWAGTDPSLPSILLNSHMDVVPVFPDKWKYPPFDAVKDENGNIYARGSQDMKCVGIQYLEAIRRLKSDGRRLLRTVHLSFMPDEEIGGEEGMGLFIDSKEYKMLNVEFALDEGLASPDDVLPVFYGERSIWWIRFKCTGNPGHGSRFVENTCAEKVSRLMNQILEFRDSEKKRLEADQNLFLGDVTTANITVLQGGIQTNVIPDEVVVGVDFRIDPSKKSEDFRKKIDGWVAKAGDGITYTFEQRCDADKVTKTSSGDPWWDAFSGACNKMNLEIRPQIFPAGTDSRYLRNIGVPALGFSPMNNTPILLHDHNEYLNENVFLQGIDIYYELIPSLANVPKF